MTVDFLKEVGEVVLVGKLEAVSYVACQETYKSKKSLKFIGITY